MNVAAVDLWLWIVLISHRAHRNQLAKVIDYYLPSWHWMDVVWLVGWLVGIANYPHFCVIITPWGLLRWKQSLFALNTRSCVSAAWTTICIISWAGLLCFGHLGKLPQLTRKELSHKKQNPPTTVEFTYSRRRLWNSINFKEVIRQRGHSATTTPTIINEWIENVLIDDRMVMMMCR